MKATVIPFQNSELQIQLKEVYHLYCLKLQSFADHWENDDVVELKRKNEEFIPHNYLTVVSCFFD